MTGFIQTFSNQLIATSVWEWFAVIFAILYLLLAIKESNWCWPAAFISTSIYSVLFFDVNLYMESFLNLYYLVMAIYGWFQWNKISRSQSSNNIQIWPLTKHLKVISLITIIVLFSAYLLNHYTNQDMALVDSFTTWFAIFTTYLVTQKILENWLYWIVINAASIFIYIQKGFALTAVLFIIYILLAIVGWFAWKKEYEKHIR